MSEQQPEAGAGRRDEAPPGLPRWLKVAAVVLGLLILLFLVLHLTGQASDHGPGMHSSRVGAPTTDPVAHLLSGDSP